MGAVNFSIDKALVKILVKKLELTAFIETGAYEGDAIENVSDMFDEIRSVEYSEDHAKRCQNRFRDHSHITVSRGNSPDFLQGLKTWSQQRSVLYWLDAHWCVGAVTDGDKSHCPLLEELDAIGDLPNDSIIMIDDARLFLCPPNKPHKVDQWPGFNAVLRKLLTLSESHRIMVLNDVILFYPPKAEGTLNRYARDHGIDWLSKLNLATLAEQAGLKNDPLKQIEAYFKSNNLNPFRVPETLWQQLKEKEVAIQKLLKKVNDAGL